MITHLNQFHIKNSKVIDFHGFEMPVWYEGITKEHLAVRNTVGIFDLTHMGRVMVSGPESSKFLNRVFTYDVSKIALDHTWLTSMCDERGIVIDNMMVYKIDERRYFIVFNCIYRKKDVSWLTKQIRDFDSEITDVSDETPQFALQGPSAEQTLQKLTNSDLDRLGWFEGTWTRISGVDTYISRTGYTGEDGFEIYVWGVPLESPENAIGIWNDLLSAGREFGIKPCGLGARDTLRIETGFWLEGNETGDELIGGNVTPLELGLKWAISLDKPYFIGKDKLVKQKTEGLQRKRVGIRMTDKGIPRRGCEMWKARKKIGQITSGTYSPILKCGIAMGYISVDDSSYGSMIDVMIRERASKGKIVGFPFYDTAEYGRFRGR